MRGDLPPKQLDIHCPDQNGSGNNYLATSCEQRLTQRLNRCKKSDCKRYKGKPVSVKVAKPRVETKKQGRPRQLYIAVCLSCRGEHQIKGRGLCGKCYSHHAHRKTLKNFPSLRELANKP